MPVWLTWLSQKSMWLCLPVVRKKPCTTMHCTSFISERNFIIPLSLCQHRTQYPGQPPPTSLIAKVTVPPLVRKKNPMGLELCMCTHICTHTHTCTSMPHTHTWKPEDSPQYVGVHCLFPFHQSGKGFLTTNAHSCMPMLKPSSFWALCSSPSHLLKENFFKKHLLRWL